MKKSKNNHTCFFKPQQKKDDELKVYVFYDIETTQDDGLHKANLVCWQTCCDLCLNGNECGICKVFGSESYCFGDDCIKKFVDYVFKDLALLVDKKKGTIYLFAHNARGYDNHFLYRELISKNYQGMQVYMSGRKILELELGNVKMLDSLSFLLMPLSKLPEALGLDVSLKKGTFPHLFNSTKNYNYIGSIPDLKYYCLKTMKRKDADELRKWHEEQTNSGYTFDFKNELINYCKNDVEILKQAVLKFQEIIKATTGIDPYTRTFTLASLVLLVFKTLFLKPKTIGVTPINGYSAKHNHSNVGDAWLDWRQKLGNIKIEREYRIGKYWSDGYCEETNTVFEFFGCRWHGCHCIYKNNRDDKIIDRKSVV